MTPRPRSARIMRDFDALPASIREFIAACAGNSSALVVRATDLLADGHAEARVLDDLRHTGGVR